MQDIQGKIVSEEEAAKGLGFVDVFEFRRWQTDIGHELAELKHKLYRTENDRDNFQWHLKRHQIVFDKTDEYLSQLEQNEEVKKLRLAISVVSGRGVDWDHILKDWLSPKDEPIATIYGTF